VSDGSILDEILSYSAMGLFIGGVVVFIFPFKYPKLSLLVLPVIALLFFAVNVPSWIIAGWILSAGIWFTIPIWLPLSKGDSPFTLMN
jgi:hypothetical protein